jgi:hypothetical protein
MHCVSTWDRVAVAVAVLTLLALGFACSAETPADSNRPNTPDQFGNAQAGSGAGAGGRDAFGNPQSPGASPGTMVPLAGGPGSSCASGNANTTPVTPTVWLVLDGSGSMNEEFDNDSSRWEALRSSLMDDDGLVARLERNVRFGMVLYGGIDEEDQTMPNMCVNLVTVQPALNNFATLDAQLPPEEPGGWTPTDRALEHVVANLPVVNTAAPDADNGPIYVILATDGAPNDRCDGEQDQMGGGRGMGGGLDPVVAMRVIAAVQNGVQMGMHMFIISLAGGDDDLQQHLEQVAMVTDNKLPPFVPSTREDLIATLEQIVGNASCQIQLEGTVVDGKECQGEVLLNGTTLACNSDNGWRLMNASTVQLTGTACNDFLGAQSLVTARFPCDAFDGPL